MKNERIVSNEVIETVDKSEQSVPMPICTSLHIFLSYAPLIATKAGVMDNLLLHGRFPVEWLRPEAG